MPGFDHFEEGLAGSGSYGRAGVLLGNSERHAQELTLLHQVRAAIAHDTDLSTVYRTVVEQVSAAFGYTLVGIYTLEDACLVLRHQVGYDHVLERIPIDRGIIGRVARTGQPALVADVSDDPDFLAAVPNVRSEICVPFLRAGSVAGVVNIESSSDATLDLQDLRLITEVAGLLTLAIERNTLHTAMQASEARLRVALDAAEMGAWVWYPASGEVQWSDRMAALYGLPPGTTRISTQEWFDIVHPEDRETVARTDLNFLRYGEEYEVEFRVTLPSGAVRWLEGKGKVVERGPDGEVVCAVGVTMDITGRKRLEEERVRLVQLETERAKAREAQRVITDTLERMTAGFIAVDRDWRFTYVNRRALMMLQREPFDLGGRLIWAVFPEIAGTEIERTLRAAAESQQPAIFDSFWPGAKRWLAMHAYPDGEGLSVYLQDVTERRRAEEEQRRIEARFRALVQQASDIIVILDRNGTIRYASPAVERVIGFTPEEIVGSDNLFMVHPQDVKRLRLAFVRVAKQPGVNPPILLRFRHRNGGYRWVEVTATNLFDDPAIEGIVANCRDVTERHEAEFNLWFLAETSAVLGSSLDLDTTLSSITRLVVMNLADMCLVDLVNEIGGGERFAVAHRDPEAERALGRYRTEWPLDRGSGYGPSHVLRNATSVLYPTIDDDMQRYWLGQPEGGPDLGELGLRSAIIVPMVARGMVIGILTLASATPDRYSSVDSGLIEELGRRAALAVDNAMLYQAARAAIEARDQFLSVAAHELRTPITAINGFVALLDRELRQRNDPDRVQRYVRRLTDAGNRLSVLVDDLLDVSHIRLGNLPLRLETLDLPALVERVYQRYEEQASPPGHLIVLEQPRGECILQADADRIEQVITNLIDNAIKYSPDGGEIVVTLDGQDDGVLLTVTDRGIGLEPNDLEAIFKPFGRAPNAVAGNFLGLGIGLFICRNIVERHGGRTWAESEGVGRGTTIRVWLPKLVPAANIAVPA